MAKSFWKVKRIQGHEIEFISFVHLYAFIVFSLPLSFDVVVILNRLTIHHSRSHAIHDVIARFCVKQLVHVIFLSHRHQRIVDPLSKDIEVVGDDDIRMGI